MKGWKIAVGSIGFAVVAVVVAPLVVMPWCTHRHDLNDDGDVVDAMFAKTSGGSDTLIAIDGVEHHVRMSSGYTMWRFERIDPLTGAALGRVLFEANGGEPKCAPAAPGRLWCARKKSIEVRDTTTGAVIATEAELVAKNPALHAGLSHGEYGIQVNYAGTLFVNTLDGYAFRIDPATLQATSGGTSDQDAHTFSHAASTESSITIAHGTYGDTQLEMTGAGARGGIGLHTFGKAPERVGSASFLSGSILVEHYQPVTAAAPDSWFVAASDTMAKHHHSLISRVDTAGNVLWTTPLDASDQEPIASHVTGDLVDIVYGMPANVAFGLDLRDGHVRWRHGF